MLSLLYLLFLLFSFLLLLGEVGVEGEEVGDEVGLGEGCGEVVGGEYGSIIVAVGFEEFLRHGDGVVEVGQAAVGVQGTSVKYGLGGLSNALALLLCCLGPWERIVYLLLAVTVVRFQSSAHHSHPCHVNIRY